MNLTFFPPEFLDLASTRIKTIPKIFMLYCLYCIKKE